MDAIKLIFVLLFLLFCISFPMVAMVIGVVLLLIGALSRRK